MLSFFNKDQIHGNFPEPYSITSILNISPDSPEIEELYDNDPNLVARLSSKFGSIVLKRFGWRNKLHFFISPFHISRAQRSWTIAKLIESFNVKTPKPLFVYTHRKLGFVFDNFFITDTIHPHTKFRLFIVEEKNVNHIKKVLQQLAIYIARMHNNGIIHSDLTTGNFLISENNNVYIVDLNRAKFIGSLSVHQRLTDLAKIYFKPSNVFSQKQAISHFFYYYTKISGIDIEWESKYLDYRKYFVTQRDRFRKIKRFVRIRINVLKSIF